MYLYEVNGVLYTADESDFYNDGFDNPDKGFDE